MSSRLRSKVLELVKPFEESRDLLNLATQTGINYFWLVRFAKGKTTYCDVDNAEKLYSHITGQSLEIR